MLDTVLAANPFFDAYFHSDFLGKAIFLSLIALSVTTWVIVIQKVWITLQARKLSSQFYRAFNGRKAHLLGVEYRCPAKGSAPNPFLSLYQVLKKHTVDILNKNRHFNKEEDDTVGSYLSPSDIDFVESHLMTTVATETKNLEKNLFILATIVSLAPFLGLLGTVWGILSTFSELQAQSGGNTNQMVLGGLSLALATTVLGLVDAIPALIGYNYLKNNIRDFETEMECFSNEILTSVEMQYRKVDVK